MEIENGEKYDSEFDTNKFKVEKNGGPIDESTEASLEQEEDNYTLLSDKRIMYDSLFAWCKAGYLQAVKDLIEKKKVHGLMKSIIEMREKVVFILVQNTE